MENQENKNENEFKGEFKPEEFDASLEKKKSDAFEQSEEVETDIGFEAPEGFDPQKALNDTEKIEELKPTPKKKGRPKKSKSTAKKSEKVTGTSDYIKSILKAKVVSLAYLTNASNYSMEAMKESMKKVYEQKGLQKNVDVLSGCKSCAKGKFNKIVRDFLRDSHIFLGEEKALDTWSKIRVTFDSKGVDEAIKEIDKL